ncbi:MAG: glycosyltransferase [Pseudomonadota bacterium]
MTLAIFTRQIGHYHDARFRGAVDVIGDVTIISTANEGGFAEFVHRKPLNYSVIKLFEMRTDYDAAVAKGNLAPSVEDALSSLKPTCIAVSGWTNPESMAAIRWGRRNNVPLIMMSESQSDDAARSRVREAVKHRVVSLCDAALVGGPPHADYVETLGIPRNRVHFGYNAVDNAYFSAGVSVATADAKALRAALRLPKRYLLASARFIEKKNLPVLVEAFAGAIVQSDVGPIDLVILGDGPEKPRILEAARASGVLDRIHLPGFRGYDVLPAYYGLADGFVHVSTVEQWGLVVNEAMASGLPVIVSDRCGVARSVVKDWQTGFVTTPDKASVERAIGSFLTLGDEAREAMGLTAQRAIGPWGPKRFGEGMKAAMASAMSTNSRGKAAPWDAAILSWMQQRIVEAVA